MFGCGGGDHPVTSPCGKLSRNGVPQPASRWRCLSTKDRSPGCHWAGVAERTESKRAWLGCAVGLLWTAPVVTELWGFTPRVQECGVSLVSADQDSCRLYGLFGKAALH